MQPDATSHAGSLGHPGDAPARRGRVSRTPGEPVDDIARVYGWMQRVSPSLAAAETLTTEVFRRLATGRQPAWLSGQPAVVRQRFSCAQVVLERRGVL